MILRILGSILSAFKLCNMSMNDFHLVVPNVYAFDFQLQGLVSLAPL